MQLSMPSIFVMFWLASSGSAFAPLRSPALGSRIAARVNAESGGRGFGKAPKAEAPVLPKAALNSPTLSSSVDETEILASSVAGSAAPNSDGRAVEERQAEILRKFGLGKIEERKSPSDQLVPGLDVNLPTGAFDADGDLNLLAFIPIELQGSIESFLYFTTGTLLVAFLLAGVAITWDAYAVSTKGSLPESLADLIQNVIEPNFTLAGVLFLASSSSLGIFKLAQFSNPGVQFSVKDFDDIKEVE